MVLPLLGYFFCMIAVLTAAAGAMIGLFSASTSARGHHYPRPVVERTVKATNTEQRLFMVVPETDRSSVKNTEANSAAVLAEKRTLNKTSLTSPKCSPVSTTTTHEPATETRWAIPKHPGTGHSVYSPTGDHHFPPQSVEESEAHEHADSPNSVRLLRAPLAGIRLPHQQFF